MKRVEGEPNGRREARRWIRQHWADLIRGADMGGVGDMNNDFLDEVWEDECRRISERLVPGAYPLRD